MNMLNSPERRVGYQKKEKTPARQGYPGFRTWTMGDTAGIKARVCVADNCTIVTLDCNYDTFSRFEAALTQEKRKDNELESLV